MLYINLYEDRASSILVDPTNDVDPHATQAVEASIFLEVGGKEAKSFGDKSDGMHIGLLHLKEEVR